MPTLAICLHFRAPLGGLQENILATALAARDAGWGVTVLAPAGPFLSAHVMPRGIAVLAVDFGDEASLAHAALHLERADVIHAHPGPSRVLALEVAKRRGIPLFYTVHGAWSDGVHRYAADLAHILCVSEAVHLAVEQACPDQASKILTLPNGVDLDGVDALPQAREAGLVVVASRYDIDKRPVVDTLLALWREQHERGGAHLRYAVAGDGTCLQELKSAAATLGIQAEFVGWLGRDDLFRLYKRGALAIASGRAAMEALACGCPTLALASGGAAEAFTVAQLPQAAFNNFGGYGAKPPPSASELLDRMLAVLETEGANASFSVDALGFVRANHDNRAVNARILALYAEALDAKGRCSA